MAVSYIWTDGENPAFRHFWRVTEEYYNRVAGGAENRRQFMPYNLSSAVEDVLLVFEDGRPAACAGLKPYSGTDAEVKRVWVEPEFRGRGIASRMMELLEEKAREKGYRRTILQTREAMADAVGLYTRLGYRRIGNYPPYDRLGGAVCFARDL
jgi:ribosomal protein S18 acetylase RimI-like enzyme